MDAAEYIHSQMLVHYHRHHLAVLAHDDAREAHELLALARLMADLRALDLSPLIPRQRTGAGRRSTDGVPT